MTMTGDELAESRQVSAHRGGLDAAYALRFTAAAGRGAEPRGPFRRPRQVPP